MTKFKDLRVLIVDDEEINIELASIYLETEGYTITTASGAQEALEKISKESIALILLDINMPQVDGFKLCQMLKSEKKTEDIPIIFLTAQHDIEYITKAFEIGGADYITKPFNALELKARVKVQLQNILYLQEIKEKQSKLAQLSITDQLTKLYNTLYFESHIKTLKNKEQEFWVLYIKINNFDKVNTLFGFYNANKILQRFAKLLRESSFKNGVVARLFGANFAIVMKAYPSEEMQKLYSQLIKSIQQDKHLKESINISAALFFAKQGSQISIASMHKTIQNNTQERAQQLLIIK